MRELHLDELNQVGGGLSTEQVAAGLGIGAFVMGTAGQVIRFIPGAQLVSAGFTLGGLGFASLAGALLLSNRVVGTASAPAGSGCSGDVQCIVITGSAVAATPEGESGDFEGFDLSFPEFNNMNYCEAA